MTNQTIPSKVSFLLLATVAGIGLATAQPAPTATLVATPDIKWTELAGTGGVQISPLRGDLTKGAHEMLVKFPAGSVHPLHTHTSEIKMVVISGAVTYGPEGGPEKAYEAGSYIVIPGGVRHTSGCKAGAPCIVFHQAPGKFDLHLVTK